MGTPLPQLSAHKGLRGQILLELKRAQPLTATELAEKLGVSPNAVRHHLKELEAERLIVYGREQRGVGAPTFAYRLSGDGEGLFPRRYEQTRPSRSSATITPTWRASSRRSSRVFLLNGG